MANAMLSIVLLYYGNVLLTIWQCFHHYSYNL